MPYVAVVFLSLGVGAVAYLVTIRAAEAEPVAAGFEPEDVGEPPSDVDGGAEGPADEPRPGYTYLEVAVVRGPTWRERLQGLVGTLVLVVVGMAGVAGALYLLGAAINRTIQAFVGQ